MLKNINFDTYTFIVEQLTLFTYWPGVVRWPAAGDTAGSSLHGLSSLQHRIYNLLGRGLQMTS